ncbi:MAG: site-specific integrase [Thermoplasmatota archaeon]
MSTKSRADLRVPPPGPPFLCDAYNFFPTDSPLGGAVVPKYKAWWSLGVKLGRYEQDLLERGLSETTVKGELWALGNMGRALWEAGFDVCPRRFGQFHIDYLRSVQYEGREQSYIAHNLSILKQFLKWAGNKQTDRIRWPVRGFARSNADWLQDHEAMILKQLSQGIERMIVHCEVDLGLRRIEVLRLKVSDFRTGRADSIKVLGKGRHGGKPREISWHQDTPSELEACLVIRDGHIARARSKNPNVEVPESLLIYERGGGLYPYKKSAVDGFLEDLGSRSGIEFSNHTLRRTCGRMMHRSGSGIVEIAGILGHSDPKTTMLYLGLDIQDMSQTMNRLAAYQKTVKIPGNGILGDSQQKDGPCGI